MSTLVVSNISDGTTTVGASYVTNGSAKAWVNFNGTGTIAARDSLNLSSLTDNGTGDYTVNFSNAFGAADYSICSANVLLSGVGSTAPIANYARTPNTEVVPTSSNFRFSVVNIGGSTPYDNSYNFCSNQGDLA